MQMITWNQSRRPSIGSLGMVLRTSVAACLSILGAVAQAGTSYVVDEGASLFGHLNQSQVPDCGEFACGPTAAVNSFVFLENKYPNVYKNFSLTGGGITEANLKDTAKKLVHLMGCTVCDKGTKEEGMLSGKRAWFQEKAPNTTLVTSMESPSWSWIFSELQHGEDVEVLIGNYLGGVRKGGHWVTLTGMNWNDVNGDQIIDADESAAINVIDPSSPGDSGGVYMWQTVGDTALRTNFRPTKQRINCQVRICRRRESGA